MDKQFIAIDLKSFYASVECRERGLNPVTTNLVVTDIIGLKKQYTLLFRLHLRLTVLPDEQDYLRLFKRSKELIPRVKRKSLIVNL